MKTCSKCKNEKPLDQFNKTSRTPDGLHVWCKACANEYARENYRQNKARYFAQARARTQQLDILVAEAKDKPCADCGVKYPPYVMDLDHRDPSQKVLNLAKMKARKMAVATILEEIAKCDVVCANCHRMRTHTVHPSRLAKSGWYEERTTE